RSPASMTIDSWTRSSVRSLISDVFELQPLDSGVLQNRTDQQHILVIEDERMILDLLVEQLTHEGYVVRATTTLDRAFELLEIDLPALVILDLMLPVRSGWEFLEERRQNPALAEVPVLVVSAAHRDRLAEALQMGATACLHKP